MYYSEEESMEMVLENGLNIRKIQNPSVSVMKTAIKISPHAFREIYIFDDDELELELSLLQYETWINIDPNMVRYLEKDLETHPKMRRMKLENKIRNIEFDQAKSGFNRSTTLGVSSRGVWFTMFLKSINHLQS